MKHSIDFSLILPCFNEAAHFRESVAQILSSLSVSRYRWEVIFVDDGSTDSTRKLITAVCRKNRQCRYVFHPENLGRGAAVTTGMHNAHGTIVGYIDIDCEVSPLYIPSFVEMIIAKKADVVVGKRIYQTSVSSLVRWILSVGYRSVAGLFLATDGIDTESGYKFFRKKTFLPVLATIRNQGWFWDTESIVRSKRFGLRIREIPVLFIRRSDKKSSVRIVRDTAVYIGALIRFLEESKPHGSHQ